MKPYGKELILDLHDCDPKTFTRESITAFMEGLCVEIDMQPCALHFWDDVGVDEDEKQTEPHTTGTSAVQFILTSNITLHTLDILERVYVNIFSCKDFDSSAASSFAAKWFDGRIVGQTTLDRL